MSERSYTMDDDGGTVVVYWAECCKCGHTENIVVMPYPAIQWTHWRCPKCNQTQGIEDNNENN